MKDKLERIKTGIPGFDELVEGGIPKGFNLLVTGTPGTGKTIFGLQFLYNGMKEGDTGLYITLDSQAEKLFKQASQFGWDLETLEKARMFSVLEIPTNKRMHTNILRIIEDAVRETKAKRIVFDNLTAFTCNIDQFVFQLPPAEIRVGFQHEEFEKDEANERALADTEPEENMMGLKPDSLDKKVAYLVLREFAAFGTTNMIVASTTQTGNITNEAGEFACDGLVRLHNELIGAKHIRTLSVVKMRYTDHSQYIHDMDITKQGVKVKPAEAVYK